MVKRSRFGRCAPFRPHNTISSPHGCRARLFQTAEMKQQRAPARLAAAAGTLGLFRLFCEESLRNLGVASLGAQSSDTQGHVPSLPFAFALPCAVAGHGKCIPDGGRARGSSGLNRPRPVHGHCSLLREHTCTTATTHPETYSEHRPSL